MPDVILALDIGTTTCKGRWMRTDGAVEAETVLHYASAEHLFNPHDWWEALTRTLQQLGAPTPSRPLGICLCGRGGGLALLDASGEPVEVPWPRVLARARDYSVGHRAPGRAAAWAAQYRALREIAPGAADRVVRLCGVKDYLNMRLTGEWATDASSAGCRAWPDDVDALGIAPEALPQIRDAREVLGSVRADTGFPLPVGLPVLVGSHDGVCANIGAGMLAVADGCVTLGTNGVLRVNTLEALPPTAEFAAFTYPYLAGTWTSGGDVLYGGAAVVWVGRLLGILDDSPEGFRTGLARLDALAASVSAGANDLVFVPYLRGTISPRRMPDRRGMFFGVAAAHGPREFARAAFEGTALALRHIRDAFLSHGGRIRRLRLTGGGVRSGVWPAIVASVLAVPLDRGDPEASSRGAAILAAVGLGIYPSVEAASAAMVPAGPVVAPDPSWVARYDRAYIRYRSIAEADPS